MISGCKNDPPLSIKEVFDQLLPGITECIHSIGCKQDSAGHDRWTSSPGGIIDAKDACVSADIAACCRALDLNILACGLFNRRSMCTEIGGL